MPWKISAILSITSKVCAGIGATFLAIPNMQVWGAIFIAASAAITAFEKSLEEQGIIEAVNMKAKARKKK